MRILLYTGKGGAGKTTIAAATAVRCAGTDRRTLLMGGDASQSLADCLNLPLSDEPQEIAAGLWAQELDSLERLERFWPRIEPLLAGLLNRPVTGIAAEELNLGPGIGDLLRLLALKEQCDSGAYDVLVMDLGSSLTALQMLSYPESTGWWIDRLLGQNDAPASGLAQELEALAESLADLRSLLTDPAQTSVRLVTTAEQLSLRETMRALTFVSLYGCNVDAVILNRQKYVPRPVADAFAAWPLLCITLYDRDIIGLKLLGEMARDLFPEPDDPAAVFLEGPVQRLSKTGDEYVLSLRLPFIEEGDIDLLQHNGQLILQLGRIRRVLQLPPPVDGLGAADAVLDEGVLEIHFR
ncbi:MAG TPA: ArsA family ATPase [Chloroflexota bacterium]|nr:ArsA family ATPase [Chloroflexota bacterium]